MVEYILKCRVSVYTVCTGPLNQDGTGLVGYHVSIGISAAQYIDNIMSKLLFIHILFINFVKF